MMTPEDYARARALRAEIRALLEQEKQAVVMAVLSFLSGQALASLDLKDGISRETATAVFCQQVSDLVALIRKR
jgi:hypothetical protein